MSTRPRSFEPFLIPRALSRLDLALALATLAYTTPLNDTAFALGPIVLRVESLMRHFPETSQRG